MVKLYATKTILPAVENMPKTPQFLRDTFFPRSKDITVLTNKVELDYRKGKRKMAPFVAPRVGGITNTREGFTTQEINAPRIAPQRPMTIDDITQRGLGEDVYSKKSPAQRQLELTAKDLEDLGSQIDRREEWMVAQLLFEGKVILKGYSDNNLKNFVEQEIDYGFDMYEDLSGADLWSEPTADPYSDLENMRIEILQKGGIAPNIVILGKDAYAALRNNDIIQKLFDKMNMSFGVIQPSLQSDAITFVGKLPGLGLELYTYDDWYLDEDGKEHPFVPTNKILVGHTNSGNFIYGAVTQMETAGNFVTYEADRVPKFWADVNNDSAMTRLTSRPVPKPDNINSWLVATVV
ncbi:major capsid protein [Lysinibacillus sphaericus]|uniref:major capsid protein n=1 Tax=Lysinibacillus sphaericus TaxID=1421 RepID=UPI0009B7E972|nr:major capsid protein [Lysinibacillus sphaericus]